MLPLESFEAAEARAAVIAERGGSRDVLQAELAAEIDRLERKGLVQRDRIPGDRRGVECALTDDGRDVATKSRARRRKLLDAAPLGVAPKRIGELVEVLRQAD